MSDTAQRFTWQESDVDLSGRTFPVVWVVRDGRNVRGAFEDEATARTYSRELIRQGSKPERVNVVQVLTGART